MQPKMASNSLCSWNGLELIILLSLLSHGLTTVPPYLVYAVLRTESKILCMLDKHSHSWAASLVPVYLFLKYHWAVVWKELSIFLKVHTVLIQNFHFQEIKKGTEKVPRKSQCGCHAAKVYMYWIFFDILTFILPNFGLSPTWDWVRRYVWLVAWPLVTLSLWLPISKASVRVSSNQPSPYISTCIISVSHCHCSWGGRGISFQRWRKWSHERDEFNSLGYSSWRTQANAACSILRLFLSPGNPHCLDRSLLSDRGCPDGIVAWCRSQQLSCSYLNSGEESWSEAVPQSRCVFQTVKLVLLLC